MLTGGLTQAWPHDRAHWFFSRARWNPDELGIAVAKLVVALAARMADMIADAFPGRQTGVVADSAYAGAELKKLPARITWTTRLRKDAALCELPPPADREARRPPRQGRPAPQPGQTRRHSHLAAGDRHPVPHDSRRPGRRDHLPVVLGLDEDAIAGWLSTLRRCAQTAGPGSPVLE